MTSVHCYALNARCADLHSSVPGNSVRYTPSCSIAICWPEHTKRQSFCYFKSRRHCDLGQVSESPRRQRPANSAHVLRSWYTLNSCAITVCATSASIMEPVSPRPPACLPVCRQVPIVWPDAPSFCLITGTTTTEGELWCRDTCFICGLYAQSLVQARRCCLQDSSRRGRL